MMLQKQVKQSSEPLITTGGATPSITPHASGEAVNIYALCNTAKQTLEQNK